MKLRILFPFFRNFFPPSVRRVVRALPELKRSDPNRYVAFSSPLPLSFPYVHSFFFFLAKCRSHRSSPPFSSFLFFGGNLPPFFSFFLAILFASGGAIRVLKKKIRLSLFPLLLFPEFFPPASFCPNHENDELKDEHRPAFRCPFFPFPPFPPVLFPPPSPLLLTAGLKVVG